MYSLQTLRTRGLLSLAAAAALAVPSVLLAPPASAAVSNGGFETGTLTGWTSAGATAVIGSGAHSSTYAARVGGTSHAKGDSALRLVSHDDDHRGAPTFARFDDVQLTAAPALTQIDTDPFTNSTSQHATVVEPDTFASGNTVIAVAQNGRFFNGGASGLGWARSADGGVTWTHGTIPGITVYQGGAFSRVSDPSVVYDARHATWLVAGLPLNSTSSGVTGAGVTVSRSTTGGVSWQSPVRAVGFNGPNYDKPWITCDNTPSSPFYGRCYIEVDNVSSGNRILMSTSTDGGLTWSAPVAPSGSPSGLAGQPLVQSNGKVVVPYSANGSAIRAFNSTNGGASWSSTSFVHSVQAHTVAGGLRAPRGIASAEVSGGNRIFVAWHDCRFRANCTANDIVYSTSTDGVTWSGVTRVPIDSTTSGVDHFLPGLGVDRTTSGTTTRIGLHYYFYPSANCTSTTCRLQVGYISSANRGATWTTATALTGPFPLSQIANTNQGRMVGDYISTSIVGGRAVSAFPVGRAPTTGQAFDEALYTAGPLTVGWHRPGRP
ncbi:exo-alpha-sialidase [Streptomyces diastatochromogenes]|uniref:exo-alpha-sialidase n=1 Tax=Streptomyces diastatochromogenes TaxID=42236 RepID=UPI003656D2A2